MKLLNLAWKHIVAWLCLSMITLAWPGIASGQGPTVGNLLDSKYGDVGPLLGRAVFFETVHHLVALGTENLGASVSAFGVLPKSDGELQLSSDAGHGFQHQEMVLNLKGCESKVFYVRWTGSASVVCEIEISGAEVLLGPSAVPGFWISKHGSVEFGLEPVAFMVRRKNCETGAQDIIGHVDFRLNDLVAARLSLKGAVQPTLHQGGYRKALELLKQPTLVGEGGAKRKEKSPAPPYNPLVQPLTAQKPGQAAEKSGLHPAPIKSNGAPNPPKHSKQDSLKSAPKPSMPPKASQNKVGTENVPNKLPIRPQDPNWGYCDSVFIYITRLKAKLESELLKPKLPATSAHVEGKWIASMPLAFIADHWGRQMDSLTPQNLDSAAVFSKGHWWRVPQNWISYSDSIDLVRFSAPDALVSPHFFQDSIRLDLHFGVFLRDSCGGDCKRANFPISVRVLGGWQEDSSSWAFFYVFGGMFFLFLVFWGVSVYVRRPIKSFGYVRSRSGRRNLIAMRAAFEGRKALDAKRDSERRPELLRCKPIELDLGHRDNDLIVVEVNKEDLPYLMPEFKPENYGPRRRTLLSILRKRATIKFARTRRDLINGWVNGKAQVRLHFFIQNRQAPFQREDRNTLKWELNFWWRDTITQFFEKSDKRKAQRIKNRLRKQRERDIPTTNAERIMFELPQPRKWKIRKAFEWLVGPFGKQIHPRWDATYFCIKVEIENRSKLERIFAFRNLDGLIMLSSTCNPRKLSDKLTDIKFVGSTIGYFLYFDPTEIERYRGSDNPPHQYSREHREYLAGTEPPKKSSVDIEFHVVLECYEGSLPMIHRYRLTLEYMTKPGKNYVPPEAKIVEVIELMGETAAALNKKKKEDPAGDPQSPETQKDDASA